MTSAFILFMCQFSKDLKLQSEFLVHSFLIDYVEKMGASMKTSTCLKCLSLIF